MASAKCKTLTLEERVNVIKLSDGRKSARKIADELGVGRTQIQCIIKRKAEVLSDYESNVASDRKRKCRKTGNEEINRKCWEWFCEASSRRIVITGHLIQQKALEFAKTEGNTEFKASNGWLDSFVKRHNVGFGGLI